MKRFRPWFCTAFSVWCFLVNVAAVRAQDSHEGHHPAASPTPTPASSPGSPPGPEYTQPNLVPQPGWPKPVMDQATYQMVLFEVLEYAPSLGGGRLEWDMVGWRGGDYNRLWIKSEGSVQSSVISGGEVEFQALYGRLIAPFFDFQAGLRYDQGWGQDGQASRFFGAIGLQGLAPYWFEVEPVMFISQQGQLSARLTASRELTLTQRTFLQARFEANAALQSATAFGVGSGLNDSSVGLRLRHELRREFAPYVGVTLNNRYGETAEFVRQRGEAPLEFSIVAGTRLWY